jgi:hypothetical protein
MKNHLNISSLFIVAFSLFLCGCFHVHEVIRFDPAETSRLRLGQTTRAQADSLLGYPQVIVSSKEWPMTPRCWVYLSGTNDDAPVSDTLAMLRASGTVSVRMRYVEDIAISGHGDKSHLEDTVVSGKGDSTFVQKFSNSPPGRNSPSPKMASFDDTAGYAQLDSLDIESLSLPIPFSVRQFLLLEFVGDTLNGFMLGDSVDNAAPDTVTSLRSRPVPRLTTLPEAVTLLGKPSGEFFWPSALASFLIEAGLTIAIPTGTTHLLIYTHHWSVPYLTGPPSSSRRALVLYFNADGLFLGQQFVDASTK